MSMDLTGCGVKVFQYQPATLHTKVLTTGPAVRPSAHPGRPSTMPRPSPSGPQPTDRSPTRSATSPTATPGTWRPPRWNPTSTWPHCSRTARPRHSAAARALERAAELSPGEPDKARRLLAAAELALPAGQADWVRELAGKVLTLTSDPDLRIAARLDIGWSLLWSNRNADAFDTLLSVAAEASPRLPAIAWQATWMAATVAHQTGLPEVCARARAALDLLDSRDGPPPSAEDWPAGRADEYRIWIRACTDPFGERADIVPRLRRTAGGSLSDPGTFGAAAWVLNETELAVRVLREALSRLRAPGVRGASGGVLSALEWACVDSGRWDDALAAAREAGDIAAAYKMETVAGSADLTTAIVAAMRGEHDQVAPLLAACAPPWTPPNTAGSPPGSGRRQVSPRWPRAPT
ncbi:hypothetical protein ACFY1B_51010 [Streptomyces mirabilis]|uniref:hypothetical protein n=1 Tax=Streptomyces mirabilis TaxID=68239 RepID=UPI0036C94B6C